MFTGIIEDVGTVKSIEKRGRSGRITIETSLDLSSVKEGDSIAVEGACVTVVALGAATFTADLSEETLRVTTLGGLTSGCRVNLEPALTLGKPLGGHFVSGHIDGVGKVVSIAEKEGYIDMEVTVPMELSHQLVKKGSVAVDGISLTVADLTRNRFKVAVIPHTLKKTTLESKKTGSSVNIETDIIGKYVQRFLNAAETGLTKDFLVEQGFYND